MDKHTQIGNSCFLDPHIVFLIGCCTPPDEREHYTVHNYFRIIDLPGYQFKKRSFTGSRHVLDESDFNPEIFLYKACKPKGFFNLKSS